ncbi:hypothetical protein HMPREF1861_00526 [Corynebacterium kroppenstedtii]|nr:hypothetical protein HMPREF1861_00526 [Corynebacterium kroppenstedtii]
MHGRDFITIREGRVILFALTNTEVVDKTSLWITSGTISPEYP